MTGRPGLEIRSAEPGDAPRLAELLKACGQPVAPLALADRLDALRRAGGVVLLALEWGLPSGAMALHWLQPLARPRIALASTLVVAPDARRRGVARLLLKSGSQAARSAGCDELQLIAPPGSAGLDAFCEATGFSAAGALRTRPLRKRS